jgi:hypothetical protein
MLQENQVAEPDRGQRLTHAAAHGIHPGSEERADDLSDLLQPTQQPLWCPDK